MDYLLDTGVLIRLTEPSDAAHPVISEAVKQLWKTGARLVVSMQNIAEFWVTSTRPKEARGGLGLSIETVAHRLRMLEAAIVLLPDPPTLYEHWRQIVFEYRVFGVQAHDARIAAFMAVYGIKNLITLNSRDFRRYPWINVIDPHDVARSNEIVDTGHQTSGEH